MYHRFLLLWQIRSYELIQSRRCSMTGAQPPEISHNSNNWDESLQSTSGLGCYKCKVDKGEHYIRIVEHTFLIWWHEFLNEEVIQRNVYRIPASDIAVLNTKSSMHHPHRKAINWFYQMLKNWFLWNGCLLTRNIKLYAVGEWVSKVFRIWEKELRPPSYASPRHHNVLKSITQAHWPRAHGFNYCVNSKNKSWYCKPATRLGKFNISNFSWWSVRRHMPFVSNAMEPAKELIAESNLVMRFANSFPIFNFFLH